MKMSRTMPIFWELTLLVLWFAVAILTIIAR